VRQRRVLLAIRPRLLRDALRGALYAELGSNIRIRVLDDDRDHVEILFATKAHRADVVIATVDPGPGVPPLVRTILSYYPELHVIAIDVLAQSACHYRTRIASRPVREFSPSGIAEAVVNCQPGRDQRGPDEQNS
jgi:hypothetical protein